MKILGITGGSGTGKTTVSKLFSQRGFYVIDADVEAREVVKKGGGALAEIEERFGKVVINADGTLNRGALADIVFKNADKLTLLNAVTHKYITERIDNLLAECTAEWAVIDAAALVESGLDKKCDKVIAVTADFEVRKARIIVRDSLSEERAEERIRAQKSMDFYISAADFVIENNGDEEALRKSVDRIIGNLELKQ